MAGRTKAKKSTPEDWHDALRHPLRARVLALLITGGPNYPAEIARAIGVSTQDVNYHMGQLVDLGCAELVDTKKVKGGTAHIYRATDFVFVDTEEWDDLPEGMQHHLCIEFLRAHFHDADAALRAGTLGSDKHFHLTQTRLLVDERGREELLKRFEAFRLDCEKVRDESLERLADGAEGSTMSTLLGCFPFPGARREGSTR